MQWSHLENAGFSKTKLWLRINPDYLQRNVKAQEKDDQSLLSFYKKLLKLRKDHVALMQGNFEMATKYPANTLVYFRCVAEEQIMIALNFDGRKKQIDLNYLNAQDCELLLSSYPENEKSMVGSKYILQANEAAIFSLKMI
jgi:glycosidase